LSNIENSIAIPDKNRYDEAYMKFVNGEYEDAIKILNEKYDWLRDLIYNFFRNKTKLSFSLISIDNPYWFLKNYILKLNEKTDALYYGSNAHDFAESIYKNELDMESVDEEYKDVVANIKSVINAIKTGFNMEQIAAEVGGAIRVNQMFDEFKNVDDSITFFGKLDAVFSDGDKYLILDYKTDKNSNNIRHHMVQLLSYKILYSVKNNIDINKISTALGYISMRGNINTHRNDSGVFYKEPDKYSEKTLKGYIKRFLDYRENPEIYIKDLINSDNNDTLFNRLINILK
jgi:DNA helicase-2/ATP-dependent DNA helicase PcrA